MRDLFVTELGYDPVETAQAPRDLLADEPMPTYDSQLDKYNTGDDGFDEDEKRLIGELFTPEELEEIKSQEPIGFLEALKGKGWGHMLPYVGTGQDIGEGLGELSLIDKAKEGDASAMASVKQMLKDDYTKQIRGTSIGGKIGNIIHYAPSFMGEMAVAAATFGSGAAPKATQLTAQTAVQVGKKAVAKKIVSKMGSGAIKSGAITAGMIHHVPKNYLDRKIAGSVQITDKGEALLQDMEEAPATTAIKALGDVWVEVASEMSGGVITKGISKVASPVTKAIGKSASPVMNKALSGVPAKVKDAVFRTVKKFKPDANISRMLSDKVYFNGIIGEIGEERWAGVLKTTLGLDEREISTTDKYLDALFPDKSQLLAEIGAFSMMGVSSHAATRAYRGLVAKGFTPDQAKATLENMSESEKEKLSGEIGLDSEILPTVNVPVDQIFLSKDIPNFKEGVNEQGVVVGEQLSGKYDTLGTAPIVLWERTDGRLEVITGRHRLDLAKRTGLAKIPSQIVKESEGFTLEDARLLDVAQNIRDEKGSVKDYARFFKEKNYTREQAEEDGFLSRIKGRQAISIATAAVDNVYSGFINGKISEGKAAAIADGAPNNEAAQAAGLKAAKKMSPEELRAYVSLLAQQTPTQEADGDLFGFDDTAIKTAADIAKLVGKDKKMLQAKISAVRGALKNPDAAREMGLIFEVTPENIEKEIKKLEFQIAQLDNFFTNPDLMSHYRGLISGKSEQEVEDKALKNWFGNSKVVDKKGKPKKLYHGRTTKWSVFDPQKSSVYSLFGQAFYSTDSKEIGEAYKGGVIGEETADANVLEVYIRMEKPYNLEEKITDKEIEDLYNLVKNDPNYSFHWKRIAEDVDPNVPHPEGIDLNENSINPDYVNRASLQKIKDWLVENDGDWKDGSTGVLTRGDVYSILTDQNRSISGKKALNKFLLKDYDGITYKQKGTGLSDRKSDVEHNVYVVFDPNQIKAVDNQGTWSKENNDIYKSVAPSYARKPKIEDVLLPYTPENVEKVELASRVPAGMNAFVEQHNKYVNPFYKHEATPMDIFKSRWVDYLEPLRAFGDSVYKDARLFAGVGGKIAVTISDHTETLDGVRTGEGLLPIVKDFRKEFGVSQKVFEKDFGGYLIAKRYNDLVEREDVVVTDQQIQESLDTMEDLLHRYGDGLSRFEQYAERVYDYQKRVSYLLVESGLISERAYKNMLENNPHYVPFKRILDDNRIQTFEPEIKNAKGRGLLKAFPTLKKIKGSDMDIRNPFASIVNNTASILVNANKNKIVRQVANLRKIYPHLVKEKEIPTASYDKGLRKMLVEGAKKLGVKYERTSSRLSFDGAFGVFLPFENKIREKIGVDAALAHEFGHALDHNAGLGHAILHSGKISEAKQEKVNKELVLLANERLGANLVEVNGRFVRLQRTPSSTKYAEYLYSEPEVIANLYDAYINAPDLLKEYAPTAKELLDKYIENSPHQWLRDIHRTLEVGFEEMRGELDRAKNIVSYYRNGHRQYIEVHEDLYDALSGVQSVKLPFVVKMVTSFPAALLRWGATQANITFALIRNPLRDTHTAAMQTHVGFLPVIGTLKGAGHKILNTETYKEWKMSGGSFDSFMQINENSKLNPYKELFGNWNKLKMLIPTWYIEKLGQLFEEGTRVGVYDAARKSGFSRKEAAFISRDSTIDFSKGGYVAKQVNQFIPFFNANVQGLVSMTEKFKRNPIKMAIKALTTLTIPSIALAYYYTELADDEDKKHYAEIPTWQKNLFWNMKVGDKWVTIPKPFAYGAVFATLPQAITEGITTEKDVEWAEQAKNIFENFNFIGDISGTLPPAVKIMLELQANKSFYTGQDIIPTYLLDVDPTEQYTDKTSELVKEFSDLTGLSPLQVEHVVTSAGAGVVRDMLSVFDMATKNNAPAKEKGEIPVARGIIAREPIGYNSKSVQDFMDQFEELSQKYNTFKKIERENPERADEYAEKHEKELDLYEELKTSNKEIREISREINSIARDEDMSPKEKQKEIRELKKEMTSTAKEALGVFEDN